jgi:glutathione-regulated potassium-efflux system ancillary protein KefF
MILVVYAHPYPTRSRACKSLVEAISGRQDLEVRSLYELYPDFDIDGKAERQALERARLVVWLHPFYWYGVPALLKHWFDQVLVRGWAHGGDGRALEGKDCLWVTATGGGDDAFTPEGRHGHSFEAFEPPIKQTARYCGMNWLAPFALKSANSASPESLHEAGEKLDARLDEWANARSG